MEIEYNVNKKTTLSFKLRLCFLHNNLISIEFLDVDPENAV